MPKNLTTHDQADAYSSPWPLRRRIAQFFWQYIWALACAWTPKPLNPWRLFVLKLFGTRIYGTPFVHGHAKIQQPWNLTLHHRSCLGDGACAYTLGPVTLHEGVTIAQEAYLCTGTHDFSLPHIPLQTAPIVVEKDAFVGARAFILPGVVVGEAAVVGACAVVSKPVPARAIVAGNPAKVIGSRAG